MLIQPPQNVYTYIGLVCGYMWIEEWTFKRHHVIKEMIGLHAQNLLIILDSIVNIGVGGDLYELQKL